MKETAVVILNYNGQSLLRKFLPSVISFSPNARIVVADNCSTDASVEVVRTEFPSVDLIQIPENRGFCGGYNFAIKHIPEKYCVLINSDVEVTSNWLSPMIHLLEQDASIGAVQPKILAYHNRNEFEYAGAAGGELDSFGYPFCRGRIFNETEKDEGQYDTRTQIFWASGACFFVRTELFNQISLDEDFFAHMEEIDFCWKLNRLGFKVFSQPESIVYHVGGGTLAKSNPKKTYLNFRNGLSLIFKHWSVEELIFKLPLRIVLDWIAGVKFLLVDRSPKDAFAVIRAHYHFVKNLIKDSKKRSEIRKLFPLSKPLPFYQGSIVFQFYVLGKKKFSELQSNQ